MSSEVTRKETLLVAANQIVVVLGTILTLKLYTNFLPLDEFGKLALALALISGIQLFFSSLANALMRYHPVAMKSVTSEGYFKVITSLFIYVILLLVVLGIGFFMTKMTKLSFWISAVGYAAIAGLVSWFQSILSIERRRSAVLLLSLLIYIFRPILAAICFELLSPTAPYAIYSSIICGVVALLVGFTFVPKISVFKISGSTPEVSLLKKNIWDYSYYYLIAALLVMLLSQVDRWAVNFWGTLEMVAVYSTAYMLAQFASSLSASFLSQLMTPAIFGHSAEGKYNEASSDLRAYLALSFAAVVGGFIFFLSYGLDVVLLLTNETLAPAVAILPILYLALSVDKLTQVLHIPGLVALKIWPFLIGRLAQLVVLAAGIILFGSGEGVLGVAGAQLCASLAFFVSIILLNRNLGLSNLEVKC